MCEYCMSTVDFHLLLCAGSGVSIVQIKTENSMKSMAEVNIYFSYTEHTILIFLLHVCIYI